ncbi:lpha-ketoglutarate-dependentdichlorophenoxyacetate [Diaporthe amygdali]|uniref:lpha-ketoglutarate- dependentdichlorophenoxyacetate n=1 Tax=Phomopsis amygdali TaxID=1214568 RepID=UPI0022FE4EA2|nr:lpha-ketoglutarate-dependentdichlorophenoxyacetate [Diaporthe amygdali]KAJ0124715.1 lpha-ketoglutarate-dependentdichlorophenoxyacetate [Diaporthe amygdali]
MPGIIQEPSLEGLTVKELHPTFGAEIEGVNFESLSQAQFAGIKSALAKYGFVVFRRTGLDDDTHVAFSKKLGELDNIKRYLTAGRKLRYENLELFDAGNLDGEGEIVPPDSPRAHYNKGNALFHVDSSFNPRRASYSALRAVVVPPVGEGGETEFADARTAWDDLDQETRALLLGGEDGVGLVGGHSISHSRKIASPEFFKDLDVEKASISLHRLAQVHEPSERMSLYVGAHLHHVEGLDRQESDELIKKLNDHVTQPKYVTSVGWENPGDLIIWDNRAVLHRATGGSFEGKYKRDMRRTTVHDDGSYAYGLNDVNKAMPGFDSWSKPGENKTVST